MFLGVLKIFTLRLFLNATSGTHVYNDKETIAGKSYLYK